MYTKKWSESKPKPDQPYGKVALYTEADPPLSRNLRRADVPDDYPYFYCAKCGSPVRPGCTHCTRCWIVIKYIPVPGASQ
eukprot:11963622-Prorocentrum_lima.AAC.1